MQRIVQVSSGALYQYTALEGGGVSSAYLSHYISLRLSGPSDNVAAKSMNCFPSLTNESVGQSDECQHDYSLSGDCHISEQISWLCGSTASHSSRALSQPWRKGT